MKEFIGLKISTEKKERDMWAIQVMNELVQCASSYKCKDNGRKPRILDLKKTKILSQFQKPYLF